MNELKNYSPDEKTQTAENGEAGPKGAPGRKGAPSDPYRERILAYAIDGVKVRVNNIAANIARRSADGPLGAQELHDLVCRLQDLSEELQFLEGLYNDL